MKWNETKKITGTVVLVVLTAAMLAGCGNNSATSDQLQETEVNISKTQNTQATLSDSSESNNVSDVQETTSGANLEVRFGDDSVPFELHMENNETAQAIARYVGTSDWRLPVYDWDDSVDYSVMEYYDIPSRYEIPSDPETVTEAKAGEVFYSDPNRIVLFYHDAEISEEYVKIGTFDATDEFISAVENNPVLEGWGNKIIHISQP